MNRIADYFDLDTMDKNEANHVAKWVVEYGKTHTTYGKEVPIRITNRRIDYHMYAFEDENGDLHAKGMHYHCASLNVWHLRVLHRIDADEEVSYNFRKLLVTRPDGDGLIVVNLINADVLPCLTEGTLIMAQIAAYPYMMSYFEDDKAYEESILAEDGKAILSAEGSVFALGFMNNNQVDEYGNHFDDRDELDNDLTLMKGTVKKVVKEVFELDKVHEYYHVTIETLFGDIEIVHTLSHIEEEQRHLIKEGSVVFGMFWLQADPAILKYENICIDEVNNYRLLKHTFEFGEADRLSRVLSDDVIMKTVSSEDVFEGKEAVINRLIDVNENIKARVYTDLKILTDIKNDSHKNHKVGDVCIALSYGEKDNVETLAFVEFDDNRLIKTIQIEGIGDYYFKHFETEEDYEIVIPKKVNKKEGDLDENN